MSATCRSQSCALLGSCGRSSSRSAHCLPLRHVLFRCSHMPTMPSRRVFAHVGELRASEPKVAAAADSRRCCGGGSAVGCAGPATRLSALGNQSGLTNISVCSVEESADACHPITMAPIMHQRSSIIHQPSWMRAFTVSQIALRCVALRAGRPAWIAWQHLVQQLSQQAQRVLTQEGFHRSSQRREVRGALGVWLARAVACSSPSLCSIGMRSL